MKKFNFFIFISLIQVFAYAGIPAAPMKVVGTSLLTGKHVSIAANEKNKDGMIVVFLSARCPCSNSHIPELKKLSAKYPNYKFLAVHSNTDEEKAAAKAYFKGAHLPFEVISDEHTKIANQFYALKTPHAFLLNRKGEVLYQGGMTSSANAAEAKKNYLASALEEISNGKSVTAPESSTLGCAILREDD